MTTTNKLTEVVLNGAGAVVWWDFESSRVKPERMQEILTQAGDATVIEPINQRNAVVRAAREWRRRTYRAEVAFEDANEIVIGILHRENPKAKEVAWKQVDQVTYSIANGKWASLGSTDGAAEYVDHADMLRSHLDHQWLRPWCVDRFERMSALRLKKRSAGFHFVGNQFFSDIQDVAWILSQIGSCGLNYFPVQAGEATQKAVAQAAAASTHESLSSLRERLDKWRKSARKVSDSSAENVLAAFADLKDRCVLYADAVEISLSDLQDEIDAAKDEARALIDESAERSSSTAPKVYVAGEKMHWSHRRNVDRVKKVIAARPRLPDEDPDALVAFTVDEDELQASGFPKAGATTALYWNRVVGMGCGAAAQHCGFTTKAYRVKGNPKMLIDFTPIPDFVPPAPEAEEPKKATKKASKTKAKPETDADAADEAEDARADLREQLTGLNIGQVRVKYDAVFGAESHKGFQKKGMITKLVAALG